MSAQCYSRGGVTWHRGRLPALAADAAAGSGAEDRGPVCRAAHPAHEEGEGARGRLLGGALFPAFSREMKHDRDGQGVSAPPQAAMRDAAGEHDDAQPAAGEAAAAGVDSERRTPDASAAQRRAWYASPRRPWRRTSSSEHSSQLQHDYKPLLCEAVQARIGCGDWTSERGRPQLQPRRCQDLAV